MFPPPLRWLTTTLFFLASGAAADEPVTVGQELDDQAPVFNFNVSTTGYPPYLIHNDDDTYGGLAFDVVSRVTERLGYQLNPLKIPRKRVDGLLLSGYIDATLRAREWAEEPERFLFSDTIVSVREVFFSPADSDFQYDGPDTLRDVTVVTPLGYH